MVLDSSAVGEAWGWKPRTLMPAILEEIAQHTHSHQLGSPFRVPQARDLSGVFPHPRILDFTFPHYASLRLGGEK